MFDGVFELRTRREVCYMLDCLAVVQVNDTIMRQIVTNPDRDYIFVTDYRDFGSPDNLINQACRTLPPLSTSTTSPWHAETSALQYLFNFAFLPGVLNR